MKPQLDCIRLFAMSDLEMYVLPFLGIILLVPGSLGWLYIVRRAAQRRAARGEPGLRWLQFSLGGMVLWLIPFAALVGWILSWEGVFFTKRAVLSQKAGALTLLVLVYYAILFGRSVRRLGQQQRTAQASHKPVEKR